ncbi:microtubule-associated protein TORTIFOLIA1-like isoform X1 [Juglans microcarpa x Juglans regia]|uniref:microtubule-associated protein TORTIFOLIA1-like isoform X1 n=1 Tax=Juglans microcarpa x Juglans regia TaxID=2249226 RepID=UPI001B7DF259|nr:microtubule-associated protein TORTIFOLIA1-like isoform X1 [Juglans microcarpa x Juglans regia]
MSSQDPKSSSKPFKSPNLSQPSRSSSLSSHLAMVELKQKILTSLSKLSDRDTHQIAMDDLQSTIHSLSPDALPMLLNSLYDAVSSDPKPSARKDSLRLLALTCSSHPDAASAHLTKIIAHVVKRLKDNDSAVRDACRDAIGSLSALYLKNAGVNGNDSVVGLFVRPLFEAMGEQNKGVQSGAAMCVAKMVECASEPPPISAFQKLCPRICRLLNNPNFLSKASLLSVVVSLSQVGAIAPQSLENLLQSIHECLGSTDWATRKAAAEALSALALHSSDLVSDKAASTLTALESCRFDKIKPVRDSMVEALQLWKKISGKGGDGSPDGKTPSRGGETPELGKLSDKNGPQNLNPSERGSEQPAKNLSNGSSPSSDSVSKAKGGSISERAVVILKKKAPALTDKDLNLEFFQKLETRGSGDLPVEVVVPRRYVSSSNANNEEEPDPNDTKLRGRSNRIENTQSDDFHGSFNSKFRNIERVTASAYSKQRGHDDIARDKWPEERVNGKEPRMRAFDGDDRIDTNQRESSGNRVGFSKTDAQSEGSFINNKGSWLAIQRQLLQLERQQAHLMNMLQGFMGGSHDSMVTLENRVRGLERVVEDMAQDLSIFSGRRGGNFAMGFEGSSNRPLGKYSAFPEYSSAKFGRGGDGRIPFGERIPQSDGMTLSMRGRGPPWRSDMSEAWDFPASSASRNGQIGSRRALGGSSMDGRSPKSEHESDQGGSRRAWDKGTGPVRLGEGPSARSVWQASKDEATLEAIRVAGEDSGTSQMARVAIPEMTAEALGDDSVGHDRDPVWTSWSNAMDALQVGDVDSAYADVLSTGDSYLLVKLMDRSGPVLDQLSNEVTAEILLAVAQFLLEQNLFDFCLSWIHQLVEMVLENGSHVLSIPMEVKKELVMNLNEASSTMDPPEDWEGATPDQLLLQLASAWGVNLQQHEK